MQFVALGCKPWSEIIVVPSEARKRPVYFQSAIGKSKTNAALKCRRVNLLVLSIEQAHLKLILVLGEAKLDAVTPVAMLVRRPEYEDKKLCGVGSRLAGIGRKR